MARSDKDGTGGRSPDGESQPSEFWIETGTEPGGDLPPRSGPPSRPGRTGRARWIGLVAGFAVLVAVIAVQHATGGSAAAPTSPTSQSVPPTPTGAASTAAPATAASSVAASTLAGGSSYGRGSEYASSTVPGGGAPTGAGSAPAAPVTATVRTDPLPTGQRWELVGYGPDGVISYRPATGRLTVTPVPRMDGTNPSVVVTANSVIIRSMDDADSYLVPDGKPATPLTGLLGSPGLVLPGPDPGHVWVAPANDRHTSLVLVDAAGTPAGPRIDLPDALSVAGGYSVSPDGDGYALVKGLGGVYDARPDWIRLVTHGQVAAVGPTAILVYDCTDDARCSASVVDRKTGARRPVPGLAVPTPSFPFTGPLSPDGSDAAILRYINGTFTVELVNVHTGRTRPVTAALRHGQGVGGGLSQLVFTPDSRYLLVVSTDGVIAVDTRTGTALGPLPVPRVSEIAVRAPAGAS